MSHLTTDEKAAYIMFCAENLCRQASTLGLNLTISRRVVPPLAMGNAVYEVEVWPARQATNDRAQEDRACMDAYNDEYHKVRPGMGIDEWTALWAKGETPPQKRKAQTAPGFTHETNGLPTSYPRLVSEREWSALPANLREGCTVRVPGVGDI